MIGYAVFRPPVDVEPLYSRRPELLTLPLLGPVLHTGLVSG